MKMCVLYQTKIVPFSYTTTLKFNVYAYDIGLCTYNQQGLLVWYAYRQLLTCPTVYVLYSYSFTTAFFMEH